MTRIRRTPWWALLAATFALSGCAAGRLYDRGLELEKTGHPYDAMAKYLDALDINAEHADSVAALRAIARKGYDEKLAMCATYEQQRNFPSAMDEYKELQATMGRVKTHGGLSFAIVDFRAKQEELNNGAAEDHYVAAEAALAGKTWKIAIAEYDAAQTFKSGYKDTPEKTAAAYYSWGDDDFTAKRWRSAAEHFNLSRKSGGAGYRDAGARASVIFGGLGRYFLGADRCRQAVRDLRAARNGSTDVRLAEDLAKAEECSVTPVAIMPLENPTGRSLAGMAIGDTLSDSIGTKVQKNASEFVHLVERTALQIILSEQHLSATGVSTGDVSKIRGVRYLVLGKVTQIQSTSQGPTEARRSFTAQESFECTQYNNKGPYQATCTRNVTIGFLVTSAKITARVAGSIKVVDTKSGEQLATQALEGAADDSIEYAHDFTQDPFDRALSGIPDGALGLTRGRTSLRDEGEIANQIVEQFSEAAAAVVVRAVDGERTATDPPTLAMAP